MTKAESQQDIAPSVPSVMFGYEPQTQDLLSIASNGALNEQSAGVYVLSALEMQEVQGGGRFKKFWKRSMVSFLKVLLLESQQVLLVV